MDDQTLKSPLPAPEKDLSKLSQEEEETMIRSLRTKFKGAEDKNQNEELHTLLNSLELADKGLKSGTPSMEGLKAVLSQVDMLWRSNSSYMAEVTEMLADASRDVPAQTQVAQNGISMVLLKLLASEKLKGSALLGVTYELLEMASQAIDIASDDSLPLLIHATSRSESHGEGFACLVNSLNAYLQKDKFQQLSIINEHVEELLSIYADSFKGDDSIMSPLRLKLNHSLADISALPAFPKYYPLRCPVTETLISWLSSDKDDLKICACVILGNVARDDEVCKSMLHDFKIHLPLISMLKRDDAKATVLHCSLGFLKNLAIAGDNREYLGEADVIKAVSRLWALETLPHAQLMAVSLTRQTILTSVSNIGRLLEPISSDADSPASRRTYLSLLLVLFGKTDSSPIKTEIGRTVAAELVDRLFTLHKDVARPIGIMITQTEWPIVQSEGWFALALVASHPAGSQAVVDCLESMCVIQSLCDTVRSTISPPEPGESAKDKTDRLKKTKDRDNALFLLHGLMRNNPSASELPESLRDMFEGLLREAGHEPPQ
ncbi:uncharacterized protein GIQ15_06100 [Arthroderma uncinatum]|uniref:uncharacterized protein n=1 Tax=Arthroderma uncinatum TaxID=74035 RepID=UPI00144A9115|nr:uncharacterized protein GIQ15_06100 [Arthroderma uncinatum]KAF3480753.1 hypothetical protein GIQ15_06100 [Arthroderma uncinatum]